MDYTQVRISREYLEKLRSLSYAHKRSMARELEVMLDVAILTTDLTRPVLKPSAKSIIKKPSTKVKK